MQGVWRAGGQARTDRHRNTLFACLYICLLDWSLVCVCSCLSHVCVSSRMMFSCLCLVRFVCIVTDVFLVGWWRWSSACRLAVLFRGVAGSPDTAPHRYSTGLSLSSPLLQCTTPSPLPSRVPPTPFPARVLRLLQSPAFGTHRGPGHQRYDGSLGTNRAGANDIC